MKDLLKYRTESNHSDPVTEIVEDVVESDSGINGDVQRKFKRMKIANSDPDFEYSQASSSQQASSKRKNVEVQRKGVVSKTKDQQQLLLERIRNRVEKVKFYRST